MIDGKIVTRSNSNYQKIMCKVNCAGGLKTLLVLQEGWMDVKINWST